MYGAGEDAGALVATVRDDRGAAAGPIDTGLGKGLQSLRPPGSGMPIATTRRLLNVKLVRQYGATNKTRSARGKRHGLPR